MMLVFITRRSRCVVKLLNQSMNNLYDTCGICILASRIFHDNKKLKSSNYIVLAQNLQFFLAENRERNKQPTSKSTIYYFMLFL